MKQNDVEALVTGNMKLAQHFANQWAVTYGHNEALSFAMEGLWRAAETYDPRRKVPFGSYASLRIKWWMPRSMLRLNKSKRGGREVHVHLDQGYEDGSTTIGELIEDEGQRPACDIAGDGSEHGLLAAAMVVLTDRERDVIERRFGIDGEVETFDTISKRYSFSKQRVQQVQQEAKE